MKTKLYHIINSLDDEYGIFRVESSNEGFVELSKGAYIPQMRKKFQSKKENAKNPFTKSNSSIEAL